MIRLLVALVRVSCSTQMALSNVGDSIGAARAVVECVEFARLRCRGRRECLDHTLLAPVGTEGAEPGAGCDARRLSTGRSIPAWRTLCGRQMTPNAGRDSPIGRTAADHAGKQLGVPDSGQEGDSLAGSRPVDNERSRALRGRWQQGLRRGAMPSVEGRGGNLADAG
jgi:hypothetical protein